MTDTPLSKDSDQLQAGSGHASVIAAGNPATVAAAEAMLRAGGNAVDAAVAAAFVTFIAEIGLVHWGASGIALVHDGKTGRSVAYDFLSAMPGLGGLRPKAERDFESVTIDFGATTQVFHLGRAAVAVPGAVFGLCRMARDFGRLPLSRLLEPALAQAREGAILDKFQADTCELLAPLYTYTSGMREIFLRDGRMIRAGERLHIPNLVATLERLAERGDEELRNGRLAGALLKDQAEHGGLLGQADLDVYRVRQRAPLRIRYRGCDLLLPPPPAIGGLLTAFTIVLLSHLPVSEPGSAEGLRRFYEAMALTSEARTRIESMLEVLGDAEVAERVLTEEFVQPYVATLRARLGRAADAPPGALPGEPGSPLGNTTHLSVLDSDGMAVSLTTTAGESAGYVVPGSGFIPNNMLGEADINPHGWHAWPPGARIPSMMTPLMAIERGRVRLVSGSGGSERIRSAVLQVITGVLDHDLPLSEAVAAPRVHIERGVLQCEGGNAAPSMDALEAQGYPLNRWAERSIYFGGAHSVGRRRDGQTEAAGDDRRAGATGRV